MGPAVTKYLYDIVIVVIVRAEAIAPAIGVGLVLNLECCINDSRPVLDIAL
jgi:hypothetical protein